MYRKITFVLKVMEYLSHLMIGKWTGPVFELSHSVLQYTAGCLVPDLAIGFNNIQNDSIYSKGSNLLVTYRSMIEIRMRPVGRGLGCIVNVLILKYEHFIKHRLSNSVAITLK